MLPDNDLVTAMQSQRWLLDTEVANGFRTSSDTCGLGGVLADKAVTRWKRWRRPRFTASLPDTASVARRPCARRRIWGSNKPIGGGRTSDCFQAE